MEWEVEVRRCQLLDTGWINFKVLLYNTDNYIQYPVIKHKEKEYFKKECVCVCVGAVLCLVAQSSPTLCNPMDCSLPGSSVHGILQARVLEGVAMPSSKGFLDPGIKPASPAL